LNDIVLNPDKPVIVFGSYLKSMRTQMGIPMETVAREIRVSVSQLVLIEKEAHKALPDPVYVKGILRAYAKFIGVDDDDIIDRYSISRSVFEKNETSGTNFFKRNKKVLLRVSLSTAILIIIIVLSIYMLYGFQANPVQNAEAGYPKKTGYFSYAAGNKVTVNDSISGNPKEKLFLKIDAVEDTTLTIIVDDSDPLEYLLHPMDHMELEASEKINLVVSNAGGVKISLNDNPVDIPGKSGDIAYIELPQINR
jgi:transcriptional regulator with XRE-family HTH domain